MQVQPLHVGQMNTDHWDQEGEVFHKTCQFIQKMYRNWWGLPSGIFKITYSSVSRKKAITSHYADSAHKVGIIGYWNDTASGSTVHDIMTKSVSLLKEMPPWLCWTPISVCILLSFLRVPVALAQKFCLAIEKGFRIWLLLKTIQISPCHLSEMSYLSYRKMFLLSTESCSDRQNET